MDAVKRGISVSIVADVFNVSRTTVWRWRKRAHHPGRESFKDKPRDREFEKLVELWEYNVKKGKTL